MKQTFEIENLLSELKKTHSIDNKYGLDTWSQRFFSSIEKSSLPILTFHRKSEKNNGEWLWDLVCLDSAIDSFTHIYLACEIEWNQKYSELLYDFKKLIVAKSDVKLFICQGCEYENQKLFSSLANSIPDEYKSENETWILFISDNKEKPTYWVWNYDAHSLEPKILNY